MILVIERNLLPGQAIGTDQNRPFISQPERVYLELEALDGEKPTFSYILQFKQKSYNFIVHHNSRSQKF